MDKALQAIFYGFRIQDILDIAIISLLVYGILIWFRETASRFVLVGIALLSTIYGLARYFQLYLTAVVLQGFFAILLLALVIIFQEELRRFFERLATWGKLTREPIGSAVTHEIEVLTAAVTVLAQKRVGALIVLQGDEPLDRHLEGGVSLDGALSQPLLESIFDPHSAGHDGAALVHRNRLLRFGCHLPLSLNASKFEHMGLRHTAALGLSERCDALCVVVSEERGVVSVAHGERITALASPKELQGVLNLFYASRAPAKRAGGLPTRLRRNLWEKAAALFLACLLWLGFGYQRGSVSRHFVVPIEYRNVPSEWVIEEPKVRGAEILLTGPEQAFLLLDPDRLRVSVDLLNVREGKQKISLTRDMIQIPSNLSMANIKPDNIQIAAYKLLRVEVPVEVSTRGSLPARLTLQQIEVTPANVPLLIPPALRDKGIKIQTEPIDLGQVTQTTVLIPRLLFPPDVRYVDPRPPSVKVTVEVKPAPETAQSRPISGR
ncbi:MAG: diadenylate cyclase [bacterium]